jgi:hypothetical protein
MYVFSKLNSALVCLKGRYRAGDIGTNGRVIQRNRVADDAVDSTVLRQTIREAGSCEHGN